MGELKGHDSCKIPQNDSCKEAGDQHVLPPVR